MLTQCLCVYGVDSDRASPMPASLTFLLSVLNQPAGQVGPADELMVKDMTPKLLQTPLTSSQWGRSSPRRSRGSQGTKGSKALCSPSLKQINRYSVLQ